MADGGPNMKNGQNDYTLTPEQREDYARHFMPCLLQKGGLPLRGGKGIYLEDLSGRQYMDFTSEQFVCLLGFGNQEIAEAIYEQALDLSVVAPLHRTDLKYRLYHQIAEIAPEHLNRISFTVGGGPAIESAMKIALKNVPGAQDFIALYGGYHGTTFGTANGTFLSGRGGTGQAVNEALYRFAGHAQKHFVRTERPYCYRCPYGKNSENCGLECAEALRRCLEEGCAGPAAGVILEPIQSGGGQIPFPEQYLRRVRELCDEYGTLLIFDEIQTFCRTGKFFAAEYYGVEPDIIVFAKGIGGGMPIGGILIHDRLQGFENLMEDMQTFQGNHLSFAASLKTIEIIERDGLLENTERAGAYMTSRLREMQKTYPFIGDIRGPGLAIGVELVRNRGSREPLEEDIMDRLLWRCAGEGLFYQNAHNVIKLKPPLIITPSQAEEAMDILEKAFCELEI